MEIGEKIKALRSAKLMTQAELAGTEITRNMLSRIENGAAQPSLDTLVYLASRLNVPAGFLLADKTDEQMYLKYNEMKNIKVAYLTGDYRICRDICEKSQIKDDDEIQMILAECTMEIAKEEFRQGNLRASCEYFDLALEACAATVYNTERVAAITAMYFKYMRKISPTLSSNYFDETDVPTYAALNDSFSMYMGAFMAAKDGDAATHIAFPERTDVLELHLQALYNMNAGRYGEAYHSLYGILVSDEIVPEPVMYFVFCDLEICCKEIGDFKGAYEYSINKIELLQKLLS